MRVYETSLTRKKFVSKMQYISSGGYAEVFHGENHDEVIKVGHSTRDAYLAYVKAVGVNAQNPFFPKIKSINIRSNRGRRFYVARMERLYNDVEITDAQHRNALKKLMVNQVTDILSQKWSNLVDSKGNQYHKELRDTLDVLFKKYMTDIHDGNIMYRKTAEGYYPVVTDPLVHMLP